MNDNLKPKINGRLLAFGSTVSGGDGVDWLTRFFYILGLRNWRRKYRYETED